MPTSRLVSLQLIVNDARAASSGGTDDFMTSRTFGDLLAGTTIDVEPPDGNDTGMVSVDDRGDTATITIEGGTSDGAAIDATVECHSVLDFGREGRGPSTRGRIGFRLIGPSAVLTAALGPRG